MTSRNPNLDDIVKQLERATAQLRVLSARQHVQHETNLNIREATANIQDQILDTQEIVEKLRTNVEELRTNVKELRSDISVLVTNVGALITDVGALRGRTNDRLTALEAAMHNDKMRLNNGTVKSPDSDLMGLRDTKTNEKIPGFPRTAADFRHLKESDADRIAAALGWNLAAANLSTKQDFLLHQTGFGGRTL